MRNTRRFLVPALGLLLALGAIPAAAQGDDNRGTVKVHDEADTDPDRRNVPHVGCEFFVEGFGMTDDSGTLAFFAWPPTGNRTSVTPSGDDLTWEADGGDVESGHHFLAGPYTLPDGHYRVEVSTDEPHPGTDDHFAKAKMFWVECENGQGNPPCPEGVLATARGEDDILVDWQTVEGADAYVVYRAVSGGDFEETAFVEAPATSFVDTDNEPGVTYEYYVTAVIGNYESEACEVVEATAIPFFPGIAAAAIALVGAAGAYGWIRRR